MVSYPVVRNGIVYVGSYDNYVYALNASDGSLVWKFRTGDIMFSPAAADEYIYAAGLDKYLYALDARTGELVWKFRTGNILVVAPVIVNCCGSKYTTAVSERFILDNCPSLFSHLLHELGLVVDWFKVLLIIRHGQNTPEIFLNRQSLSKIHFSYFRVSNFRIFFASFSPIPSIS